MKSHILTIEIRNLTEIIKEQQELILSHEGKIPQIELDILMGNVRKLYESILSLNKLNNQPITPFPVVQPEPIPHTPYTDELIAHISTPQKSSIEEVAETPAPEIVQLVEETLEPTKSPEHIQPESLIAIIDTPIEVSTEEISNEAVMPQASLARERTKEFTKPVKSTQTASLFDDHPTVAEKFKGAPSLFDKFSAAKHDSSVAEKHSKNPVSDLKKSIGINEKFAFINDLFDGDLNSYNEAIDHLNNSSDQYHALAFLQSDLSSKYNWNGESDAFLKLRNLVERRFGV